MKLDTETLRELIREAIEQQKDLKTSVAGSTTKKSVGSFKQEIRKIVDAIPDDTNADDLEIVLQIFKYFVGIDRQADLAQSRAIIQTDLNNLLKKLKPVSNEQPVKASDDLKL